MTNELKSMFNQPIPEPSITEISEKQNKEVEDRKMKDFLKKQTGMKRELIKLIGKVPLSSDKKQSRSERGQQWVWSRFNNPGREDGFKLFHWQRKEDINKDYEFTRLNQKIELIEFSIEEYNFLIKPNDNNNWTYAETVYLWQLLSRFDLRFLVVYDRYDDKLFPNRSIEELKDRYYSICRKILEHRKIYDHPILKSGYNFEQENKRRTYLERTMNKQNEDQGQAQGLGQGQDSEGQLGQGQGEDEKAIKIIVDNGNKIDEMGKDNNKKTKQEANRITFEEYLNKHITENDSFVYLRSAKLKKNLPVSEKIQMKVDEYIKGRGLSPRLIPTARVELAYNTLRNNVVLYTSLTKYLEKKKKEYALLEARLDEIVKLKAASSQIIQIPQSIIIQNQNSSSSNNKALGKSNSKSKSKSKSRDKKRRKSEPKAIKRKTPEESETTKAKIKPKKKVGRK